MSIDLIILLYFLAFLYCSLILAFTVGIFLLSSRKDSKIKPISVIIAARDEAENVDELVNYLKVLDYPHDMFEVIVVDDRSSDATFQKLNILQEQFDWLSCYRVEKENPQLVGKKGALDLAIKHAKFEILAFTDADCRPNKGWLTEINAVMTDETDFLCGYSPLIGDKSIVNNLKNLERVSIFAVIAGSFGLNRDLTSVARNQVYRKSKFYEIGGFGSIGIHRSGDDDLLLQKMSPVLRKRNFMFSAAVPSFDKVSGKAMMDLETRRASKWRLYPLSIKLITLLIFIYYISLTVAFAATAFSLMDWYDFLVIIMTKVLAELMLITLFLAKIKRLKLLLYFPLAELLYLPYYLYFGIKGTFGKYKWKN
jgi:glycosyltransferase involved in cell wall biosynthesis